MVNSGEGQKLIKKKYDPPLRVLIEGKPFSKYLLGSNRRHTIFSELDFSIFTLLCGLGFWTFGLIWFYYGHVSNVVLSVFLFLLGLTLNAISVITGQAHYKEWLGCQKGSSQYCYYQAVHEH